MNIFSFGRPGSVLIEETKVKPFCGKMLTCAKVIHCFPVWWSLSIWWPGTTTLYHCSLWCTEVACQWCCGSSLVEIKTAEQACKGWIWDVFHSRALSGCCEAEVFSTHSCMKYARIQCALVGSHCVVSRFQGCENSAFLADFSYFCWNCYSEFQVF